MSRKKRGRQEWFRYVRLKDKSYRKPRGNQSKMRQHVKGKRAMPSAGFGTPSAVRWLHPSGIREVLVRNPEELSGKTNAAIRIAGTVGRKKKKEIAEKARSLNLKVLNPPRKLKEKKTAKEKEEKEATKTKEATKKTDEKKAEAPKKPKPKKVK